ncbi:hypothetical protein J7T55_010844 [Diaporthe amygdali]|uniref:uncharacterized protein n=1 Tax=Phomopsis amygdali TaxID=1214568 RepID=UPI0022FED22D|nr:uncharacterized protein J7T55_010844 [Diaporthe amygdali]KAJ0114454.1 hypothetical protein J7T55_010844 [Diaporthe amygdali]
MANVQTELTDGVGSKNLKHVDYMEQIPGVDRHFLNRCYNAVDSQIVRSQGHAAQLQYRQSMVTFTMALRKLAKRVCLMPEERQSGQQIDEITRTRAFLGQNFFDLMGFYGVDVVPSAAGWTFSESMEAERAASMYD